MKRTPLRTITIHHQYTLQSMHSQIHQLKTKKEYLETEIKVFKKICEEQNKELKQKQRMAELFKNFSKEEHYWKVKIKLAKNEHDQIVKADRYVYLLYLYK